MIEKKEMAHEMKKLALQILKASGTLYYAYNAYA